MFYIRYESAVHLLSCTVNKNEAASFGAVFQLELESTANVVNSELSSNAAYYAGVAYIQDGGSVTLDGCTISNNEAHLTGGVLVGMNVVVRNCIITGNIANEGGVMYGPGDFENCVFANNTVSTYGGVVHIDTLKASFLNCEFGAVWFCRMECLD